MLAFLSTADRKTNGDGQMAIGYRVEFDNEHALLSRRAQKLEAIRALSTWIESPHEVVSTNILKSK